MVRKKEDGERGRSLEQRNGNTINESWERHCGEVVLTITVSRKQTDR